jgi:hypothetical protein
MGLGWICMFCARDTSFSGILSRPEFEVLCRTDLGVPLDVLSADQLDALFISGHSSKSADVITVAAEEFYESLHTPEKPLQMPYNIFASSLLDMTLAAEQSGLLQSRGETNIVDTLGELFRTISAPTAAGLQAGARHSQPLVPVLSAQGKAHYTFAEKITVNLLSMDRPPAALKVGTALKDNTEGNALLEKTSTGPKRPSKNRWKEARGEPSNQKEDGRKVYRLGPFLGRYTLGPEIHSEPAGLVQHALDVLHNNRTVVLKFMRDLDLFQTDITMGVGSTEAGYHSDTGMATGTGSEFAAGVIAWHSVSPRVMDYVSYILHYFLLLHILYMG